MAQNQIKELFAKCTKCFHRRHRSRPKVNRKQRLVEFILLIFLEDSLAALRPLWLSLSRDDRPMQTANLFSEGWPCPAPGQNQASQGITNRKVR